MKLALVTLSAVVSASGAARGPDPVDSLIKLAGQNRPSDIAALISSVDRLPEDATEWTPKRIGAAIASCAVNKVDREKYAPATLVMWTCKYNEINGEKQPSSGYGGVFRRHGNTLIAMMFAEAHYEGYRGPRSIYVAPSASDPSVPPAEPR